MPHISEAAPLQISRYYTGLYTYRNPLIVPIRQFGRRIIELYDSISDGLNMENSNRLTLVRRPGYTAYNTNPVNGRPLYFFAFKPSDFPGQVYNVVDTTVDVEYIQPGTTPPTVLVPKTTPKLTNFAQVGAYLYMGQENFSKKWDGPAGVQGITKWGIDIASEASANGPKPSTTQDNVPLQQSLPGTSPAPPWSNNTVTLTRTPNQTAPSVSQILAMAGFGFQLPNVMNNSGAVIFPATPQTISGIQVDITGMESQGEGISLLVGLIKDGNIVGDKRTVMLPTNTADVTVGGPGDIWNAFTPSDIDTPGFGVGLQAVNASSMTATYSITGVTVTVFTIQGPPFVGYVSVTPLGAPGQINAQIGYQYQFTYGNSYSGHISSPTPPYPPFPPLGLDNNGVQIQPSDIIPHNQAVQIKVTASTDPQVNQIHVYRTTDGGGQPFFELPNSPFPNVTQVITDNALDNQLQETQICPTPHFNDPPPFGMVDPVWFGGRLWGHKKNNLFFASGPDITQGSQEEAWFPAYQFALPNEIIRKFALPSGMLVVSTDVIWLVRGTSTASFTITDFMLDTGMRVWTAGDSDGTNIYIYTSDKQLLLINANGITSISQNIADRIQAVDPALAYLAQFRFTATQNWLFLGDGSTFLYPYNQELQAWATLQAPVGGVGAIGSVEIKPGVWQFWRGKPILGSTITYRNVEDWSDEGIPYPCQVIFGPITVADYTTLAQIKSVCLALRNTSTVIIPSILPNEILPMAHKQFEILEFEATEPPEIDSSISFINNRYTWKSTTYPELVNFVFLRLDFSAANNPDELWNWTIAGTQTTGGSSLGAPGQLPQLQGR